MKRYKGLGRVFSFTLTQQLRQRGWRTATIAVALACLLIPILSLTVAAQHQKNAAPEQNPVMEEGYTQEALDRAVQEAVTAANAAIRQRAAGHPELKSMGTTLVSALVKGDKVLISNVGDSRAYLAGADGLRQISRDHSLVEDMVEKGDLTPGQARSHPRRNLITRALGPDPAVEADGFPLQWKPGDFLLLCSDGLVNTVTDQEIMFEILHNGQPEGCLQRLMAISKQRGAPDNVTAILLMND